MIVESRDSGSRHLREVKKVPWVGYDDGNRQGKRDEDGKRERGKGWVLRHQRGGIGESHKTRL